MKSQKTGCAATAVAQLMAIYRFPASYNGYTFDWIEMRKSSPNTAGIGQIARLMQQLGLSNNLDMDYGVSSSGALPSRISPTLVNFGYANGGRSEIYESSQIINELMLGFPVLVYGYDGDAGHMWLGHGLIELYNNVKGYNELDEVITTQLYFRGHYILYNWGWSGSHDGYFLSGIFDAHSTPAYEDPTRSVYDPYNFQNDVHAITNIRKY